MLNKTIIMPTVFVCVLFVAIFSHADRICIQKSTGKFIEYQSGSAPLGTLIKNAINAGYDPNDIEEKYVTESEARQIIEQQVEIPAREKHKKEKEAIESKIPVLRLKLGLSEKEFEDLRQALKDY